VSAHPRLLVLKGLALGGLSCLHVTAGQWPSALFLGVLSVSDFYLAVRR
jgi:hypothetical protein